jgi:hypothetical protein
MPFDFDDGQWYCGFLTKGGFFDEDYGSSSYYYSEDVELYCDGDTVINDTIYNKLFYRGTATKSLDWVRNISGYYDGIRQDITDKRVYVYTPHKYYVLYDFGIKVGDTIEHSWSRKTVVQSMDSINYCNKYHKRYKYYDFESSVYFYLIEGIGSNLGLFPIYFSTAGSSLMCYSEKNADCDTCETPYTKVNQLETDNYRIYPNPTRDKIIISSGYPILSIEIFDLQGRLIGRYINLNSLRIEFYLEQKGIYLARIKTTNESFVGKFVKL